MNKIARKLVLSIVSVVLAVFALGTTTFAWFTLTNTATVQPFEAQIVADTGIEIAIGTYTLAPTELNWVTTLTTAEVEAYIASAYSNFRFNAVTTPNGSTYYTLGDAGLTVATSGWLELPIHFRSNSADRILWTGVTLTSDGQLPWVADTNFTDASGTARIIGESINIDAANGMRIGIEGVVGGLTNYEVYERAAGVFGNVVLNTGGDLSNGGIGDPGAMNYYYAKTGALVPGTATVSAIESFTSIAYDELDPLTYIPVLDLGDGTDAERTYFGTMTIRIWLEGWDANVYNSVLDRMIYASFQFTGTTAP